MKSNFRSPFKPKFIKDYKPQYLKIRTFNAGFKKKKDDLMILVFEKTVRVAVAYSKTSTPSAPIIWDKENNYGYCKVLIVNSGNANAHTGTKGINKIKKYTKIASKIFQCNQNEVLVSSTGVIGKQLDTENIIKKLNNFSQSLPKHILGAAKAIMTTDTFPKVEISIIKYKSKKMKGGNKRITQTFTTKCKTGIARSGIPVFLNYLKPALKEPLIKVSQLKSFVSYRFHQPLQFPLRVLLVPIKR